MLKHIPFYASLLERDLLKGKKSTFGHVLIYGAIEVHALGERGCIASNETIAKETGLKETSVATMLSQISKAGWVKIYSTKQNKRIEIVPLIEASIPEKSALTRVEAKSWALTRVDAGHKPGLNIDNRLDTEKEIDKSISKKFDDDVVKLTNLFFKLRDENLSDGSKRKGKPPTATDFKHIQEIKNSGVDVRVIEGVIRWVEQDDFWMATCFSGGSLKKNFDRFRMSARKWQEQEKAKKQSINRYDYKPTKLDDRVVKDKELTPEQKERGKLMRELIKRRIPIKDISSKTNNELKEMLQ